MGQQPCVAGETEAGIQIALRLGDDFQKGSFVVCTNKRLKETVLYQSREDFPGSSSALRHGAFK